jgi:hypothetical protein
MVVYAWFGFNYGADYPLCLAQGPKRWVWFMIGLIACIACLYTQFRTPQPASQDVSQFVPIDEVVVRGTINQDPRLTASDRAKFALLVQSITITKPVTQSDQGESNAETEHQKPWW